MRAAVQLRAMAIDLRCEGEASGGCWWSTGWRGLAADGVELVWANARDTALGFYVGLGFDVVGEGFVDPATAVPHHRIVRRA